MKLKITTLIENNLDDKKELINEHGLSLYIEVDGLKILFDTGQTGDFIKNAKILKKDLNILDYMILSHGHYDHSGGLKKLINLLNEYPKLVVGAEFFKPKYKMVDEQTYKYNGNPFDEKFILDHNIPLKKVEEGIFYITDTIMVFHHFLRKNDFEKRNEKFYIMDKNLSTHDDFDDEIVLGIATDKGLVAIVGCSHVGIVNILDSISEKTGMPIYAVIGGTHLVEADEIRMQKTIDAFCRMNIKFIAVSHCTGEEGIKRIQQEFSDEFIYNNTGNVIVVDDEVE
ncbi:MAG TPA: MBL fold metallo-hydrolase [Lachnospiraceae bacterium]|nr:MBL fold metallo-hydrolase [Lachnospiraceae bacterium]